MKEFDERKDYYSVLGVTRDATESEIKTAFRAQAKRWHPDLNKTKDALEHFEALAEAYSILTDSNKRHKYDLARFKTAGAPSPGIVFTGGPSAASPNITVQPAAQTHNAAPTMALREKYRSDEWLRLSLEERKRLRAKEVSAVPRGRTLWAMAVPFMVLGLIGWSVYKYSPTRSYRQAEPDEYEPSSLAKRYMNTWLVRIR